MKIDVADGESCIRNLVNVSAHYTYSGTPEKPSLILSLELDIAAYQPAFVGATSQLKTSQEKTNSLADIPLWQRNAMNDEETFSSICRQLEQNYDDLDIPDISGPAVSIYLTDSLLKSEKIPLSTEAVQTVRTFAADCLIYVANRSGGWDGGVQPAQRLEIPFSLGDVSESDIIELSLMLSFEMREIPTISPPETPLTKVECDIKDLTVSPKITDDFVETFENIFYNDDWQMKIGNNASVGDSPDEKQSDETLAIRIGKKSDIGFYYEIQNQPVHYAPRPLARTLESAAVSIHQYHAVHNSFSDDKVMNFADIDLNVFAKTAFSAIDNFFSPRMINAISHVDSLLPDKDKTQEGILAEFWRHRATIAKSVAETVMPIFKSSEVDQISLIAAREKFRQSLMIRLSNAFISNCGTVYKVSDVSIDRQKTGESLTGCFYGHFQKDEASSPEVEKATGATDTLDQDCLFSSGKIEYFQVEDSHTGDWRLPVLFSSENDGQQRDFALPTAYALTHLEVRRVKQNDNGNPEERSQWIQLAGAPIITHIEHTEFPLIGNEVPLTPSILTQKRDSIVAPAPPAITASLLSESAIFDYPINYEYELSARDSVRVSVAINNQKPSTYFRTKAHPLFAALVRFVLACNYIYTELEKNVVKIKASTSSTTPEVINAKKHLKDFELIFGELAAAYVRWANFAKEMTVSDEQSANPDSFDIVLKAGADGNARIDIISKKSDSKSPISFSVEIQGYVRREAPDKPDYAAASYNYVLPGSSLPAENDAPVSYLSYKNALNTPHRTILLKGVNIFTDQNVSAQIQAFANESSGIETAAIDDGFKLFSLPVRGENPDIFSLHFSDFDLSTIKVSDPTLKNYLDGFFASLLKKAAGIPILLRIAVSFSYQLQDSETDGERIVLPVVLVPSTQVIPENDTPLPIISELVAQINNWRKSMNPPSEFSSEYNIHSEVYREEFDHKAPLIVFDNVFIKTSKIIEQH